MCAKLTVGELHVYIPLPGVKQVRKGPNYSCHRCLLVGEKFNRYMYRGLWCQALLPESYTDQEMTAHYSSMCHGRSYRPLHAFKLALNARQPLLTPAHNGAESVQAPEAL